MPGFGLFQHILYQVFVYYGLALLNRGKLSAVNLGYTTLFKQQFQWLFKRPHAA